MASTEVTAKRVEVLVFDGCPNVDETLERARTAIARANVPAELRLLRLQSEREAEGLGFLGSPTVRVDGRDVDPTAKQRHEFGLQCRVYAVGGRLEGAPPVDWIVSALEGRSPDDAKGR